jgi:hypothetical protein
MIENGLLLITLLACAALGLALGIAILRRWGPWP